MWNWEKYYISALGHHRSLNSEKFLITQILNSCDSDKQNDTWCKNWTQRNEDPISRNANCRLFNKDYSSIRNKFDALPFIIDTAQKRKFSIRDFFIKCDQIRSFLRIWSHLLKISLIENLLFRVMQCDTSFRD